MSERAARRRKRRAERTQIRAALDLAGEVLAHDGRAIGVRNGAGGWVTVESRASRWEWSLERECFRLGRCETGWGLLHHPELGFVARPWPCRSRLCPVCWASKAGHAAHTWGPILRAAILDKARVYHVVLTQRPIVHPYGSALLEGEHRRWIGTIASAFTAPPDRPLAAVAGESCYGSYQRWSRAWRRLHTDRAIRATDPWAGTAVLRGTEWTLRRGKGRHAAAVQSPRWHCHGHLLVVAAPGSGFDPRVILRHWRQIAGLGNHLLVNRVTPRGGRKGPAWRLGGNYAERVWTSEAVLEILKYAYKPGAVTTYGTVDAWGCLRGTRTHHVSGALHGRARAAREAPWADWLAERPRMSDWGLLQVEYAPDRWAPLLRQRGDIMGGTWGADRSPYVDRPAGELAKRRMRIRVGGEYVVVDDQPERFGAVWRAAIRNYEAADPELETGAPPLDDVPLLA